MSWSPASANPEADIKIYSCGKHNKYSFNTSEFSAFFSSKDVELNDGLLPDEWHHN